MCGGTRRHWPRRSNILRVMRGSTTVGFRVRKLFVVRVVGGLVMFIEDRIPEQIEADFPGLGLVEILASKKKAGFRIDIAVSASDWTLEGRKC